MWADTGKECALVIRLANFLYRNKGNPTQLVSNFSTFIYDNNNKQYTQVHSAQIKLRYHVIAWIIYQFRIYYKNFLTPTKTTLNVRIIEYGSIITLFIKIYNSAIIGLTNLRDNLSSLPQHNAKMSQSD